MTQRNASLLLTPCLPWTLRETRAYGMFPDVDITVVITLFNYTSYITACLDSVVASILFDRSLAVEIVVPVLFTVNVGTPLPEPFAKPIAAPLTVQE